MNNANEKQAKGDDNAGEPTENNSGPDSTIVDDVE